MHDELAARSRAMWSTGDYQPTSRQLEPASEALVETLKVGAGHRVLDVAAGHGNCAIAAARRGADVVASDFSPTMLEFGSRRTAAAGLSVDWREADAARLPFDDATFDRVTSVFGAIFAVDQDGVASEAIRVVRDDGMVGITSWTGNGLTAQMIQLSRRYAGPAPEGAPDPFRWGNPDEVTTMFDRLDCDVAIQRKTVTFRYPTWEEWRRANDAHGSSVVARQTMPPARYEELMQQTQALTAEHNYGQGETVVFDSDYLEIVVTRRL